MATGKTAGEEHGGDRVVEVLRSHGVSQLFTLCGGHISPILTSARAHAIRVIDVRDEATAVFAADGAARLTGAPGVAAVTAGPGITNCVTALKNAQLAQSPTVVLGGAVPTMLEGRGALQDIDQHAVVAPHVKLFKRVRRVRDLGRATADALTAVCDGVQGPAFVECPVDLLYPKSLVSGWYADAAGKGSSLASRLRRLYVNRHFARLSAGSETASAPPQRAAVSVPRAPHSSVAKAGRRLAQASRPLAVIGSQALAAGTEPARVANAITQLGIPVYLSGMARGLLGRAHPLQLRHQRRQALNEADCVLLIGTPCDFRLDYGRQLRSSTVIAANRSARDARLNRTPDVAAIGDPGLFLEQLAAESRGAASRWRDWIAVLHGRDAARDASIEQEAATQTEFVNPIALLRAIEQGAGDDAIFVADGGDFVATASYILRPRKPRSWLDPGPFGTLGVGAGFGLAAALCRPEAEVWILFGDGACGYGLSEFDTFVRHRIPIIAVVGNDAGWTQIAREQVKLLHDDVGTALARSAYHEVVAGFGAEGILVKSGAEISAAIARARATAKSGRPVLINAWLSHSAFREGSIAL
jgi:thiamine pyrophosphate-dependent acetolactate synthase large subunit-like protein